MQHLELVHGMGHSAAYEQQIVALGSEILRRAGDIQARQGIGEKWLNALLEKSLSDDSFRVRVLRFIDVLPVLKDDADLVQHLHEYFDPGELPLPGIVKWGVQHATSVVSAKLLAPAVRRGALIMAQRFLGGSTLRDVQESVDTLRAEGFFIALDRLGEAVVSEREADAYMAAYMELIGNLGTQSLSSGDEINLSLKISSLYPRMTPKDPEGAVTGVMKRLRPLLVKARENGLSMCLDMEQYDLKGIIFDTFRQAMAEPELTDWDGGGVALQTYLRDTEDDLESLIAWAEERNTPVSVRLVRGAYWDQELVLARRDGWPLPVWQTKEQTDRSFERCLGILFRAHKGLRPAIATHNVRSIALAMAWAEEMGLEQDGFGFQMLYGMGDALRRAVVDMG